MDKKRLETRLAIDEYALDVALREHPDLFYQVASELALAISRRDEAKQEVDEVEATVDKELRRSAAMAGDKITEKEVESNKKLDKKVQTANDNFLEKRLEAAKWTALKEAYEQRSYALSKLVELHLANYSSDVGERSQKEASQNLKAAQVKIETARMRARV